MTIWLPKIPGFSKWTWKPVRQI
ncbi:hypothetical protein PM8797T_21248 [Gimesia maris DSM 8797]|nr:hypothetical protein PM8797T_21248 [Gimesia maris DSM 8797]